MDLPADDLAVVYIPKQVQIKIDSDALRRQIRDVQLNDNATNILALNCDINACLKLIYESSFI
ncbi:hypothetical protein C7W93_17815 [Glaciimonas sp. PCH181]|nr:hypothetical protein C7W93_17815 [Glaciimonas sp. PCH181]